MTFASHTDVRTATNSDVKAIVDLVNRAFSVERFLVTGDRTDETQVRELLQSGLFLLHSDGSTLISCVYVKLNGDRCYIGLLAVDPAKQKSGIGARMMREAEAFGRHAGCSFADIRIVSVRPELPVIYHKLGYVETGVESAAVIKTATIPVHFITMSVIVRAIEGRLQLIRTRDPKNCLGQHALDEALDPGCTDHRQPDDRGDQRHPCGHVRNVRGQGGP